MKRAKSNPTPAAKTTEIAIATRPGTIPPPSSFAMIDNLKTFTNLVLEVKFCACILIKKPFEQF